MSLSTFWLRGLQSALAAITAFLEVLSRSQQTEKTKEDDE